MHNFIQKIHKKAKALQKHIVFAEGANEEILKASQLIQSKKLANIILLGNPSSIKKKAKALSLKINWDKTSIINPKTSPQREFYAEALYKIRKNKLKSKKQAYKLIEDPNYFGTMMVHTKDACGMVTGKEHSTADAIRPALEILRKKEEFHKVSGVFFMVLEDRLLLFADAAITVSPSPRELANIAIDTAETAKKFGIKPKVALLSFSTKGSAQTEETKKIRKTLNVVKSKCPKLIIDGELQVDSALVPEIAKSKCPKSPIKGDANVLIFPDLEAANIAYKLVERLAKAKAIGPILQGLKRPVNDLSRGANYKDIVNTAAITACECE
ncbi:phosphate acetyltransferase [Candidatus Peregrinibacteria bacterium]|jgi:phosphate acetyltransferase|nr:phosphate acetyltransferase [Candidatus Peregrinibacteria bacterium]